MSSTNLFKIVLVLFVLFAVGEIIFTLQKYGKNIFKPQPGSCKILEEKYCNLRKVTKLELNGKSTTYIGINLPPGVQVPIFAGADGKVIGGTEQGNPFNGSIIEIKTTNGDFYLIRGNANATLTNPNVKSGDQMGYTQSTTAKSLGYDVLFTITKADATGATVVEEDKLKELFKY